MTIEFDEQGFANRSGWVTTYQCHPITGELLGQGESYVTQGSGLPAGAYLDEPPTAGNNQIPVKTSRETGWALWDDYRGEIAYVIDTKAPVPVNWLGELPSDLTLLQPGEHDRWDGKQWVFDPALQSQHQLDAAKQTRHSKLEASDKPIAILKPAVDGGYAKPAHTQLLADWQRYRYELTLVPEQAGWPASPQWPIEPDKVI